MNKSMFTKSFTISIHALREEGDIRPVSPGPRCWNFYPRPPRGGRLFLFVTLNSRKIFLSTPSARRATRLAHLAPVVSDISIHALREEGDSGRKPI